MRRAWNKGLGRQAEPRVCPGCLKEFVPRYKNRRQKHCNKACAGIATIHLHRLNTPESIAKVRAAQVGRGEGRTYRKYFGRHEHRVVAEQMLGRELQPKEIVHHIDGNKLNNDPDNLEVITQGEHMRRHGLGIPGVRPKGEPWKYRKRKKADGVPIQTG